MTRVEISRQRRGNINAMRDWCRRNLTDHRTWHMIFHTNSVVFLFVSERDAVQFCLAWA